MWPPIYPETKHWLSFEKKICNMLVRTWDCHILLIFYRSFSSPRDKLLLFKPWPFYLEYLYFSRISRYKVQYTHACNIKNKKCNDYHIPSGMFDNKANYSLVHLSPPSAAHKENCRGGSFSLVLCNHVHTKGIIMGAIYQLIWILENPLSSRYSTLYRQLLKIKINLYYSKWC